MNEQDRLMFEKYDQFINNLKQKFQFVKCPRYNISVGEGWRNIVENLCQQILELNPPEQFQVSQIKEKFGGLRFYWNGHSELKEDLKAQITSLIRKAESEAYKTCQDCGNPGVICRKPSGWIFVACENHQKEENAENAEDIFLFKDTK